ncbi:MAG: UDP-N-acetylglucosamine--N-acetylmuramyl-(pentapeptide) pyrophosphoryl-undecaprenol N-acetylglucosamine transferase [Phycisphaerae bacterium]|nr:UDP-N-acetylglucosamine--N-acetylmuramyl-(pentapeptide) pyrophosphoryl-undecaprenol N-acetylglucosamine transferase [Phycisphaerae bacterium]
MSKSPKKTYIFAGGGSGGHLYPGLAVADALTELDPEAEIIFACTTRPIDQKILAERGYQTAPQPVVPLPNRPWKIWSFIRKWKASTQLCRKLIKERNVVAVLGLGGFASAPAMKVAARKRARAPLGLKRALSPFGHPITVGMLNPDAVPGKANKYCAKFADHIFTQWAPTVDYFGKYAPKCVVSGCPIRPGFLPRNDQASPSTRTIEKLGLHSNKKTLVIVGGSLGGHNVNTAVVQSLTEGNIDLSDWQILHITGPNDRRQTADTYAKANLNVTTIDFCHDMEQVLTIATLVIGRAGASTLAELTVVGVPSILLPYPYHKDQHQHKNAKVLTEAGAALVVTDTCDTKKTAKHLTETLTQCLDDNTLEKMTRAARAIKKNNAARKVALQLTGRNA